LYKYCRCIFTEGDRAGILARKRKLWKQDWILNIKIPDAGN
jgi:hypothetical protein